MTTPARVLVPIVEGHGEVQAVPILLRRIAHHLQRYDVSVATPIRIPKKKLLRPGELERACELAYAKAGVDGGIIVIIDADDDCPAQLGPSLLARASSVRPGRRAKVILAKREYEAWFLASATSLRGLRSIRSDVEVPPHPEEIQGAKEWLAQRMDPRHGYSETVDQAALTQSFDLQLARAAPSFDKCYRDISALLA